MYVWMDWGEGFGSLLYIHTIYIHPQIDRHGGRDGGAGGEPDAAAADAHAAPRGPLPRGGAGPSVVFRVFYLHMCASLCVYVMNPWNHPTRTTHRHTPTQPNPTTTGAAQHAVRHGRHAGAVDQGAADVVLPGVGLHGRGHRQADARGGQEVRQDRQGKVPAKLPHAFGACTYICTHVHRQPKLVTPPLPLPTKPPTTRTGPR